MGYVLDVFACPGSSRRCCIAEGVALAWLGSYWVCRGSSWREQDFVQPGEESWGKEQGDGLDLGMEEPYHRVLDLGSFGIGCLVDIPSATVVADIED